MTPNPRKPRLNDLSSSALPFDFIYSDSESNPPWNPSGFENPQILTFHRRLDQNRLGLLLLLKVPSTG
uniref:Uncharacterized protein n=1 Tax=Cannabis sativa TaxID=3483 RepID=A0A803PCA1_CANSA